VNKKFVLLLLLLMTAVSCNQPRNFNQKALSNPPVADWTVMVFLNGDNNLETNAIDDFLELAQVGSTEIVNIVAQLDRIDAGDNDSERRFGDWSETLRFRITKYMEPSRENALKGFATESDMGDGRTLGDFVKWAQSTYPAKKYMLVMWGHGIGWRLFKNLRAGTKEQKDAAKIDAGLLFGEKNWTSEAAGKKIEEHPVKSVSHDDTSGRTMMNRDMEDSLKKVLKSKLDVIGFDICLMSMVETGYAMRDVARTMIASEENEPGDGWRYDKWVSTLVNDPSIDGTELGKRIVGSYRLEYSDVRSTTLAAVSLDQVMRVAAAIDGLANAMIAQLHSSELERIAVARDSCSIYGKPGPGRPSYYNVDLKRFADLIGASTKDAAMKTTALELSKAIQDVVVENYAQDPSMLGNFGSHGLAIYFPSSKDEYDNDPLSASYQESNTDFPVEFVQDHRWDNFLYTYLHLQ